MPLMPTRQDIHVNVPLRNISVAYMQDDQEFVASKVFPSVPVQQQGNRYIVYQKEYWFQTRAQKRAPASETVGAGYRIDNSPTYFCDEWAVHHDIPKDDYDNADDYLNLDINATNLVSRHLLIRQEQIFMDQYMRPGVWGGLIKSGAGPTDFQVEADGNGYWDSSTSDPMKDIDIQKRVIKRSTGFTPNTLVIGNAVYLALRNHPAIRDVFKYSAPGILDEGKLAQVFGVPRLFVAGAVVNGAHDGQAPRLDFMTDTDVLLCHVAAAPGLQVPTAGYTFNWVGKPGVGDLGNSIKKIDMPLKNANRIEGSMYFDMRIIGRDLGVFSPKVLEKPI